MTIATTLDYDDFRGEVPGDSTAQRAPANKWLATKLRELADHIESGNDPVVLSVTVPELSPGRGATMFVYDICLSNPWGG